MLEPVLQSVLLMSVQPPEGCALGSLQLLDSRIMLVDIREALTSVAEKYLLEQN